MHEMDKIRNQMYILEIWRFPCGTDNLTICFYPAVLKG